MNDQPAKRKTPGWVWILICFGIVVAYYTTPFGDFIKAVKNSIIKPTKTEVRQTDQSEKAGVKIISYNYRDDWVYVEIKNETSRTVRFVSVDITWYDKNGRLLESKESPVTNIAPYETGVADSYFDDIPDGAYYKVKMREVHFE